MGQEIKINGNVVNGTVFRSEAAAQLYARTLEERPPIQVNINIHTKSANKNDVHLKAAKAVDDNSPFVLYQDALTFSLISPAHMAIRQYQNGRIHADVIAPDMHSFLNSVKMLIMGFDKILVGQLALDFQKNILPIIK